MAKKKHPRPATEANHFHLRQVLSGPQTFVSGMLIEAAWCLPEAREASFTILGRPVPAPIQGLMLVDTGAGQVAISHDVAAELSLPQIGHEGNVHTAGGMLELPIFQGELVLPCYDRHGIQRHLTLMVPARSIPNPGAGAEFRGITKDGEPARIIGILGRAFLQLCTLTYNGRQGLFEMMIHDDVFDQPFIKIEPSGEIKSLLAHQRRRD